jgi:hypothetical protein
MAALEDQRYRNEEEITALVRGFENCTLPFARWTHEAHLTVAIFFLSSLPTDEATEHIREGIQRYNLANGVIQTLQRGYHETITRFYIWAVRRYLADRWMAQPIASLLDLTNDLLASPYGDRRFPFEYYTRDHLMSWDARTGWAEPDRKPLEPL